MRHDGSTRQAVLKLLKTKGPGTVGELSRRLGLTEMAVRRHLNALEQDGYVTPRVIRQGMGRPAYVYELTEYAEQFFPKNYHVLALDLLEELEQSEEAADMVHRLFEGRKRRLLERYASRMEGKPLAGRVEELAAIQNAGGYMVEVENNEAASLTDGGQPVYMLHEYNCPIVQVASRYQQACSCELALFEDLLGAAVERTECLAKGGGKCSYRITAAR
ncbi:transcriptional regulator [Paenibacillus darwinianus]|uniref:Transcriptional regulator n=1 Tax=Paenibacillus darwinianus TaxID=1380763 RepID=A0A9W5S2S5_9BACL|nr:ArsR family transcriptional regulator [Paenibacillus darwinianus]EXX89442.1 transcriptional regulator [Paenibacillus darwinianus]EXX90784.1 transcriptional regulator [Paenibacillus darwinianus]EXX90842.1 transcriptional regulator [Paenibacillus darwinianus]